MVYCVHTCHKLWAEICEIRQNYKWDLIKFCETFTKIAFKLPKCILLPLFSFNKLLTDIIKCNLYFLFIKSLKNLSRNSVRFENSSGNQLSDRLNSVRFYLTVWGMACMCVYLLESPCWGDSNENTHYTFMLKKIDTISLLCFLTWLYNKPSMARTTPVSNTFS